MFIRYSTTYLEGYAFSSSQTEPNGELNHMSVDFMDIDMPSGIEFILKVNAEEEFKMEKSVKASDGLLSKGQKEVEPEDVALETVERVEESWLLIFSAKEADEGARRQLWDMKYYDQEDKEYSINSSSSVDGGYFDEENQKYIEILGIYKHEFALVDYPYDIVYLCPSYSRIVDLSTPIEIKIKKEIDAD